MSSKKIFKFISNATTLLLFLLLIFMIFIVISSKASGGEPNVFGYQLKTVLSGSMEPTFNTGSIIAVKPGGDLNRFKEDDVITFKKDAETLVTHRIIEVIQNGNQVLYKTKGDNNNDPDFDPVMAENVVAEYSNFTIPYVGYFLEFTNSKNGAALLLILPGILLLLYSGFTIWKAISQLDLSGTKESNPTKVDESA